MEVFRNDKKIGFDIDKARILLGKYQLQVTESPQYYTVKHISGIVIDVLPRNIEFMVAWLAGFTKGFAYNFTNKQSEFKVELTTDSINQRSINETA